MRKIEGRILGLLAVAMLMVGCGIGNAPAGTSDAQFKASMNKLPLDQQAKILLDGPAPMDAKANKIRQIYKDAGQKVPPELEAKLGGGQQGGGGVPAGRSQGGATASGN